MRDWVKVFLSPSQDTPWKGVFLGFNVSTLGLRFKRSPTGSSLQEAGIALGPTGYFCDPASLALRNPLCCSNRFKQLTGLYNECREVGSTDRKSSWGLSLSLPLACICWGDSARRISEEKSSRECFIYHFISFLHAHVSALGSWGLRGLGLCYRGGPGQVHQCSSSPRAWSSIASPCSKTFPFLLFHTSCHSTWRWDRICDAHIKSHFEDSVSKFLDLLPGFGGL